MKRHILISLCFLFIININGQYVYEKIKDLSKMVTPTEYQFQKFGQLPISEYTGNPTIDIPLWNIQIREYSLPITLKYHSKGIKVAEESDWVGLGWDLSFGSITQIVYDKNDLDSYFTRKDTIPYTYQQNPNLWSYLLTNGPTLSNMQIDNSTQDPYDDKTYSYITFNKTLGGWKGHNNWNMDNMIPSFSQEQIQGMFDFERDLFSINLPDDNLMVRMKFNNNPNAGDTTYIVV